MNATITCKFKIDTDPSSQSLLSETMKAFRDACDFASEHVWLTHDLVRRSLNNDLYRALRDMFGMKAQMAQSVLIAVIARYKAVLETLGCFELVEFKRPQLDLVWNRDYSITKDGCFSINTLRGRIRAPFHTDGFEKYLDPALSPRFGTAKLVYKHGCFFMHVPVTVTVPDGPSVSDITNVVGVDRGIRFLAATYDSKHRTTFYSGKDIAGKRAHYKELRRGLQQIGTPSSRRRLKAIVFSGKLLDMTSRNPVWAMVLCLLMLYLFRQYEGKQAGKLLIKLAVAAAAILWSLLFRVQFGPIMLLLVMALWALRNRLSLRLCFGAAVAVCCCVVNPLYMFSPFGFLIAHFYNEEKGFFARPIQYLIYPFMLVMVGLAGLVMTF